MPSAGRPATGCRTASPRRSASIRAASRSPRPRPPGFEALFAHGTSPLDDDACARLAVQAGLAEKAFRIALEQPATAAALRATIEDAARLGVFGVPTFVLNGELYFGNDRLVLLRHALLQTRASE